jgi:hypothetical protein
MSSKIELSNRLQETEQVVRWSISKVPFDRLKELPPHGKHPQSSKGFSAYFGDWSAMQHVFHLCFYEQTYAIPSMRFFTGASHPSGDLLYPDLEPEELAWGQTIDQGIDLVSLLRQLHELRRMQLDLISQIPDDAWESNRLRTRLGLVSAELVVTKTIQHTYEHVNEILKNALFWEPALRWLDGDDET